MASIGLEQPLSTVLTGSVCPLRQETVLKGWLRTRDRVLSSALSRVENQLGLDMLEFRLSALCTNVQQSKGSVSWNVNMQATIMERRAINTDLVCTTARTLTRHFNDGTACAHRVEIPAPTRIQASRTDNQARILHSC